MPFIVAILTYAWCVLPILWLTFSDSPHAPFGESRRRKHDSFHFFVPFLMTFAQLFHMVKGDMCLKVIECGEPKDIVIKEGEVGATRSGCCSLLSFLCCVCLFLRSHSPFSCSCAVVWLEQKLSFTFSHFLPPPLLSVWLFLSLSLSLSSPLLPSPLSLSPPLSLSLSLSHSLSLSLSLSLTHTRIHTHTHKDTQLGLLTSSPALVHHKHITLRFGFDVHFSSLCTSQIFRLPSRVPHSPQRLENTVGFVRMSQNHRNHTNKKKKAVLRQCGPTLKFEHWPSCSIFSMTPPSPLPPPPFPRSLLSFSTHFPLSLLSFFPPSPLSSFFLSPSPPPPFALLSDVGDGTSARWRWDRVPEVGWVHISFRWNLSDLFSWFHYMHGFKIYSGTPCTQQQKINSRS